MAMAGIWAGVATQAITPEAITLEAITLKAIGRSHDGSAHLLPAARHGSVPLLWGNRRVRHPAWHQQRRTLTSLLP
jgi:hypothetical protein